MRSKTVIRAVLCMLLAFLVLSVLPAAVRADSTVTFTSTADFDAGNKADPGPIWFASNGVDQPMFNYIAQPQAIYSAAFGRTYVAYFGKNSTASTVGSIFVTYYAHATGLWRAPVWVFNVVDTDGHRNPAIWVLTSGKIILIGGSHDSPAQAYRTTTTNGDISSWEHLADPDTVATYANLFEYPSGTLWFFYRTASAFSGDLGYRKSTDDGSTWSAETSFIDLGADGPYWGKWDIVGSRFYIPWVRFKAGPQLRQDVFVCYMDLSTGNGLALDGTNLGTTISSAEADTNCRVITQAGTTWNDIPALTVVGTNVYLLYSEGASPYTPPNWILRFSRYTTSWSAPVTVASIGASSSYSDLRLTSDTSGEAFIVTGGITTGCATGDCEYTGNLERWTWNGATWAYAETVLNQTKAGDTVNHPYIPWNFAEPVRLVFDQFIAADFISGPGGERILGDQKLYAWGGSGFVGRSDLTDGTYGVSTQTENTYIPSGTFALSNAKSDTFTRADSDAENWLWRFMQTDDGTGDCVRNFAGGEFVTNWTGAGTGRRQCDLRGQFSVAGDFDISLKANMTDTNEAGSMVANLCVADVPIFDGVCEWGAPTTGYSNQIDGFWVQRFMGTVQIVRTYDWVAGVPTQLGGDTNTIYNPGWLRVTRVGTTWTSYVSTDGSSWTPDETTTKLGITGNVFVSFGLQTNAVTSGTMSIRFDDFKIATGTATNSWYRRSGSWTSATQTFAGDVPRSVNVTYSGASASGYIDSIAILDSSGNVLYKDDTDRASGTSALVTIPTSGNFRKNWAVRVALAGDGSASPSIENIAVAMGIDPTCFSASNGGSLVLSMLPILIGIGLVLAIVAAMKLRQEHHESGIDLTGIIVVGVSSVVIFVVLSVVYPLVTTLGNGAGC